MAIPKTPPRIQKDYYILRIHCYVIYKYWSILDQTGFHFEPLSILQPLGHESFVDPICSKGIIYVGMLMIRAPSSMS